MAVRPIDGERLKGVIQQWIDTQFEFVDIETCETVLSAIDVLPTLTPPNEPRMINADKLAKRIAGHSNYHGDSILAAIYCAAEGKENDAPIRSIETPPKEALKDG